jgi:hypothetical protein
VAKKDSTTPWLLGAGALALVYFATRKKADALGEVVIDDPTADIPPGDDKPPTDEPLPPTPSGIKKRKNAPHFPYDLPVALGLESGKASGIHIEWTQAVGAAMDANANDTDDPTPTDIADAKASFGIPKGRTIASYLADVVFDEMYPTIGRIPAEGNQGKGWQPYIDSWVRTWKYLQTQTWT